MPIHVACMHSPLCSIVNVRWEVDSARNATSTASMHLNGVERNHSLVRKGKRIHVSGSQGSLLSAPTVMKSTIPHLTNPWAHMHAAVRPAIHPGSRQRMDCVVYRRISCIALIMFRAGKGAYSNDTTFAVSSLAHIPCSQRIKHCHQVLASCSLQTVLHRIEVQARAHLQMTFVIVAHLDRSISIIIAAIPLCRRSMRANKKLPSVGSKVSPEIGQKGKNRAECDYMATP